MRKALKVPLLLLRLSKRVSEMRHWCVTSSPTTLIRSVWPKTKSAASGSPSIFASAAISTLSIQFISVQNHRWGSHFSKLEGGHIAILLCWRLHFVAELKFWTPARRMQGLLK